jgi:hypothetical protein
MSNSRRLFVKSLCTAGVGTLVAGCADNSNSTSPPSGGQEQETTDPDDADSTYPSDNDVEEQPNFDHLHGIDGKTYPTNIESSPSTERQYEWEAIGTEWEWETAIPAPIAEYYRERYGRSDNFDRYVSDPLGNAIIASVADSAEQAGDTNDLSKREIVDLIVAFVQGMRYTADDVSSPFDQYSQYPVETLVERGGDCEDTTILLAAILRELGYGCVLLGLWDESHMALGVKGDSSIRGTYYTHNNTRYYYTETTGEGWRIGDIPDQYSNAQAEIIDIEEYAAMYYRYETASSENELTLYTSIFNGGVESPPETLFYAGFEDRSEQYYSVIEENIGTIQNEEEITREISMNPPDDIELRLVTSIQINDRIHDIDRSEWRSSPNS